MAEKRRSTIQQYFDHYLEAVFPDQLTRAITAHNQDVEAHKKQIQGAVRTESLRLRIWVFGLVFAFGLGSGVGVGRLIAFVSAP